jgi:hypothetical protein
MEDPAVVLKTALDQLTAAPNRFLARLETGRRARGTAA